MMDPPDQDRPEGQPHRDPADEVRVIHPGLDHPGPLAAQQPGQASDRQRIEDSGPHPHHPDGNPRREDAVGEPQVIDQGDDHRLEPPAVRARQQVAEHHLRPAELETIYNMDDFRFHE